MLRAAAAMREIAVGEALALECTDPLTIVDIAHFAAQTGHEVAAQEQQDGLYLFRIVKRARKP